MKDAAKIYGEALYELARSEELDGQLLPCFAEPQSC